MKTSIAFILGLNNFTCKSIILVMDTLMAFLEEHCDLKNSIQIAECQLHFMLCLIRKLISKAAPPKLPLVKC